MSRQLAALNTLLRRVVKPRIAATREPAKARRDFERLAAALFRKPPYLLHTTRAGTPELHRFSVGAVSERRSILYFHGGAYLTGSPNTHAGMIGRLAEMSGHAVWAPAYRLAPEHPAPAAFEDAVAAFERLALRLGGADRIVLGGDSAGGGLALAVLAELCRRGQRPAALFAFSPWVDLTLSGDSLKTHSARDVFLPVEQVSVARGFVLGSVAPDDPRVSPLFASFDAPPPVQIHVGTTEILWDDSHAMAAHLRDAGGEVELNTWEDLPHVWPLFDGYIPEARETLGSVARFIEQH